MPTLSNGTDTITPALIDGYASSSEAGTIVTRILGSEDVAVTLRPASLRTGRMVLNFGEDEEASATAETLLRAAHVWGLLTGERLTVDVSLVVVGTVERVLDPETREVWTVTFGWQEVNP